MRRYSYSRRYSIFFFKRDDTRISGRHPISNLKLRRYLFSEAILDFFLNAKLYLSFGAMPGFNFHYEAILIFRGDTRFFLLLLLLFTRRRSYSGTIPVFFFKCISKLQSFAHILTYESKNNLAGRTPKGFNHFFLKKDLIILESLIH